jgi:hypothetical protein
MNQVLSYFREIILIAAIILLIVAMRGCTDWKDKYSTLDDSSTTLLNEHNVKLVDSERNIYQLKSAIVQRESKVLELIDSLNHWKQVKSATRIITTTRIDTLRVEIEVPKYIVVQDETYLKVPARFNYSQRWLALSGEINKETVDFDSIVFRNDISLVAGYKKQGIRGIFKKPELELQIRDLNPYSSIKSAQDVRVTDNTRRKNFSIGVQVGYGLNGQPYLGLGGQYNLINF